MRPLLLTLCVLLFAPTALASPEPIRVDTEQPMATVAPEYLSFALDTTLLVGGSWWSADGKVEGAVGTHQVPPMSFDSPALNHLTAALAPAFLRIGGTEADHVYYALQGETVPPKGYTYVFPKSQFDALNQFAQRNHLKVMFTLNGARGPRNAKGQWQGDNAFELIQYSKARQYPVKVWELGNEVNAYPLIHQLWLSPEQYVSDIQSLKERVRSIDEEAKVAGPGSAFWPGWGEMHSVLPQIVAQAGSALDIVTWHYYPQQSRRCPIASRRAHPRLLLNPIALDTGGHLAQKLWRHKNSHNIDAPMWLGETGHAQCGGEPGLSETYASGFWWLDQLGLMATRGQKVVVRQALFGSTSALLNADHSPRPDFYTSLLWKQLMGTRVLRVRTPQHKHLRIYAHCAPNQGVSVALANLSKQAMPLTFNPNWGPAQTYVLQAEHLQSKELQLNGETLHFQGALPKLMPKVVPHQMTWPAESYGFVYFPQASVPACHGPS